MQKHESKQDKGNNKRNSHHKRKKIKIKINDAGPPSAKRRAMSSQSITVGGTREKGKKKTRKGKSIKETQTPTATPKRGTETLEKSKKKPPSQK